jgi:hypothetical protein
LDLGTGADRFEFAPERDADSTQMSIGLAFASDALISGSARVGFRRFIPQAADVPDFKGGTTNVSLSYAARETTRFSLLASRDVQYSFDSTQPYYLLAGFTAVAQQRLFGPFDLEGRLGRQRLSYRDRAGVVVAVLGRVDHAQTYGGGLGFHVGSDLRLAFNLEHQRRLSEVANRNYSGLRIGMTATYGL